MTLSSSTPPSAPPRSDTPRANTSRPRDPSAAPAPRLCLVTPLIADDAPLDSLVAALQAADIAAVLLRLAPADERALINRAKQIAGVVQAKGAALVLDQHADLVGRVGADGAHLHGLGALQRALPGLKPDRIAGVGGLKTRDDAMRAGELGADYVMFGEPSADGWRPAFDGIVDRVAWWAELFQIPCIAYAATIHEVGPLSAAGTEFVALDPSFLDDTRGAAIAIAEATRELRMPERAA